MAFRAYVPWPAAAALFLQGALAATAAALHKYAAALVLLGLAPVVIGRFAQRLSLDPPAVPEPERDANSHAFRAIVDEVPTPLLLLDDKARLHAINRGARRLFRTDGLIADPPAQLLDTISSRSGSMTVRLGRGSTARGYSVSLASIESEHLSGTIAALMDVEAELRSVEAKTLKELMQVLSHEIMGALAPIASLSSTAAEILEDRSPDLDRVRDAIATVAARAHALERFTTAYRELAKLPEPVFARVDIRELLESASQLFRAKFMSSGVVVELDAPANMIVRADADQLYSAMWAILQNAGEAALETAAPNRPARVVIDVKTLNNRVIVCVSDTGRGVDPLIKQSLFDPFFTTKKDGSGVGLSLARQIARAHGGEVRFVGNQPPAGAAFELELPDSATQFPTS